MPSQSTINQHMEYTMKVENMTSSRGNTIANQFEIY